MVRQTKAQKFEALAAGIKDIREGRPPAKRFRKDGSIPTKPVVSVDPTKAEDAVLKECQGWLRKHGILADRMNVGTGSMGGATFATYGIVGGGDLFCILSDGRHLEVECKAGRGGRLSASQQRRQHKLIHQNAAYLVVHGVEELAYYFDLFNWRTMA